jgi:hypothetical protein
LAILPGLLAWEFGFSRKNRTTAFRPFLPVVRQKVIEIADKLWSMVPDHVWLDVAFVYLSGRQCYDLLMGAANDDSADEFSAFIGGDGHRVTDAPWRLQAYDLAGPLSTSQIADLSHRFGLENVALSKLSGHLGFVLNPSANVHVIPTSRSKARAAAKAEIASARKQLTAIEDKLSLVIERLSSLTAEDDNGESPHTPAYTKLLAGLENGLQLLGQTQAILEAPDGPTGGLVRWELTCPPVVPRS